MRLIVAILSVLFVLWVAPIFVGVGYIVTKWYL